MAGIVSLGRRCYCRSMMEFFFDEPKATQAAAFLLKRSGGRMGYFNLIKMLYLADRKSLIETGSPITGDRFVSMDHGPVLSHILDLSKEQRTGQTWRESIRLEGYDVVLMGNPQSGRLCDYDENVLNRVFDLWGHKDWQAIKNHTHGLPEWADPEGSSTRSIPLTSSAMLV